MGTARQRRWSELWTSTEGNWQSDRIPTRNGFSGRQMPHPTPLRPAYPLVAAYVEPSAGIEPATPSLPSMRGGFTTPCGTTRDYTTAQVRGAVDKCFVRRGEVACSAVSGKSLARSLARTPAPSSRQPSAAGDWRLFAVLDDFGSRVGRIGRHHPLTSAGSGVEAPVEVAPWTGGSAVMRYVLRLAVMWWAASGRGSAGARRGRRRHSGSRCDRRDG
jgi:hypothetical protein